jgi:hypothetical protein
MPDWSEITATTLFNRSRSLADIIQKNNALTERLAATITSGNRALKGIERKRRNQRRALSRWRAREARRNADASALVPSTPALAAAERGLPKLGAPDEDLRNAIVAACETDSLGHFYLQRELRAAQQRSQADIERSQYRGELQPQMIVPEGALYWRMGVWVMPLKAPQEPPASPDLLTIIRERARSG